GAPSAHGAPLFPQAPPYLPESEVKSGCTRSSVKTGWSSASPWSAAIPCWLVRPWMRSSSGGIAPICSTTSRWKWRHSSLWILGGFAEGGDGYQKENLW